MAEALLGIVLENLQSFVREELATFWGVDSQIQKLSSILSAIHELLQDAEKQQITSQGVKGWLQKLSDAAHVVDDILDECSIQYSNRLQYEEGNSGVAHEAHSLCLTPFSPKTILFRYDIGKRVKGIVKRFQDIDEERKKFKLHPGFTQSQQEDDEWRQTCSAITVDHQIYGRDQDKQKIVEFLLSNPSDIGDFSVYPIVGMGGLGKTTLARWVFNDDRVIKHFDLKIWVCVSDKFDAMRILQAIVESTMGQNPNLSTLESMQKKVQEVLFGKRYLLVLDDVWNEDRQKWENLKSVLNCGAGTKAASVLVTTRLDCVALIMGTCQTHHLLPLSVGDDLSVFKHHAFGPNKEGRAELVAIGEEIVKKCAGSPLACEVLGSLLRNKNEEKWLSVKESKFWDTDEADPVMRALRISYFNLKLPLRRCFFFCAIYPEDFEISKEQLIHLWMANGLIKSKGNEEVEDVGNETWEELCQRSFFQEVKTDLFGNTTFKIHDLFHELARFITGEECKFSEFESLNKLSNKVHHIGCSYFYKPSSLDMDAFKKFESLRTFVELYPSLDNCYELKAFNFARALQTSSSQLSALKSLTHLRYLNICKSCTAMLPESVCMLQKLQILKLKDCDQLYCLPKHLTQLKDLRHILIKGCWFLEEMPPSIGVMRCLKTLNTFIVDSKIGYGLEELRDLELGGKLHIKGLENVLSESDARSACLIRKKDLNRLYLSWNCNSNSECTANAEPERVLEALEPHPNLKSFGMKGYRGTQLPSWMMNTSILSGLVRVILYDCKNCEQLPPLGKLPHLAILNVSGMSNVKYMDDDSYDGLVEEKAFKSLKELTLSGLPNLERMLRDESVEMLPHLSRLSVSGSPKLRLPLLQSVERIYVDGIKPDSNYDGNMASFLKAIVQNMPHVKDLCICQFPELKVLPDELGSLSSLQDLSIFACPELESFSENVLQGLSSLRTLDIGSCYKLKSLSEGFGHLTCLEHLEIFECPELVTLSSNTNQLTALRHVRIAVNSTLPEGLQRIPSLQTLDIHSVDSLPEWLGDMASLQQLNIDSCEELTSLPSSIRHLTNSCKLSIESCPQLEMWCRQNRAHIRPPIEIWSIVEEKVKFSEKIQRKWNMRKIQRKWNMRKMKRGRYPPRSRKFDYKFDSMVDGGYSSDY